MLVKISFVFFFEEENKVFSMKEQMPKLRALMLLTCEEEKDICSHSNHRNISKITFNI